MTGLLVSVRSAEEAEAALAGGAKLIDVKEPRNGALGRASDATITEVLETVAGRAPVSAALGELTVNQRVDWPRGLAYCKFGLAGWRDRNWREELGECAVRVGSDDSGPVLVTTAYVDWERAAAPSVREVADFALARPGGVFLIDTWSKQGSTLLDWLSLRELESLRERCTEGGMRLALAGSLGLAEIERLAPVRPDWIAVRGAACAAGRAGVVTTERVRRLAVMVESQFG